MSTMRYKKLLTNLPAMASIVNSFSSPEVQLAVYKTLIEEFDEGTFVPNGDDRLSAKTASLVLPNGSVEQELAEGDSIHSLATDRDDE